MSRRSSQSYTLRKPLQPCRQSRLMQPSQHHNHCCEARAHIHAHLLLASNPTAEQVSPTKTDPPRYLQVPSLMLLQPHLLLQGCARCCRYYSAGTPAQASLPPAAGAWQPTVQPSCLPSGVPAWGAG